MNYSSGRTLLRPLRLLPLAISLLAAWFLVAVRLAAADTGTGSLSISVTSSKTHNALQGATVSIPALRRDEITDDAGNVVIKNLPPGPVEVTISYNGFVDQRRSVTLAPGEVGRLNAVLEPSDVVTMEKFTVETQKEGQALSITEQRNALNIKNVTAFDEWGILPTQNVGELVSRLPGITFTTDEDQLINNVSIAGQPSSYTRLNIDGMSSTGVGGDGRTATLHSFSASQYEEVEIIRAQTPDKRADSLGGQLNLKTRSPLSMSERQRFNYTVSGRWFPPWSDRNFAVSERPFRPDFSASYTGVYDVLGGTRNLGIVVGASYQEVLNPHNWDLLLYQNSLTPWLQDYTKQSGLNDRFISAFSARADYRWSPSTRVSLRFLYNAGSEPFFSYTAVNPFGSANLSVYDPATNPNGSIVPGYTATRTEIRPTTTTTNGNVVGAAQMRINPQRYSFTSKNPTATLVFEHNWGKLKVDHAYRFSNTHWDSGAGRQREDGTISVRTKDPIGFILDYSNPNGKVFTQTSGPSVYNAASYTPFVTGNVSATQPVPQTSSVFNKRDTITNTNEWSGTANASYALETRYPVVLKAGVDTVNRRVFSRQVYPRRWYQVPGTVLPTTGLMPTTEFEIQNGGPRMPIFDPAAISTTLNDPSLWYEDVNFTATSQYSGRYIMEEGVDAAYAEGTLRAGRLTLLSGLRGEWVRTHTITYFRARTTPIAAEPDPFKRAGLDFDKQSRNGQYHKWFPSYHAVYDILPNLKARASWSTSYGRPTRQSIIPTPVINDANRTVTIGNASLKPQMAKSIDLKLEYYYKDGEISVGGYKKRITDYISSATRSGILVPKGPDNGFDGLAEDYEIIQAINIGDATLKGLEVNVRQRLAFLPGLLKGLTVHGNYTYLETYGRFAGTTNLQNGQVAGFLPHSYNAGVMYTYRKFTASWDINWTGKFPTNYPVTPGTPNSYIYRRALSMQSVGMSYKVLPQATVFVNLNNFEQHGQDYYIWSPDRPRQNYTVARSLKFGITGQF